MDHVYATDGPDAAFKLSVSGLKYFNEHIDLNPGPTFFSVTYFTLYNSDHTIFKTITVPQLGGKRAEFISYVSETLFDTDTLIEYMLYYSNAGLTPWDVAVIKENGTTLLFVDSADFNTGTSGEYRGSFSKPIFPNGNQTKLYLNTASGKNVYNLPGQLPCLECDGGLIAGLAANPDSHQQVSTAFPNPSREHFTLKYILPANAKTVFLEIYDMQGSIVKKSKLEGKSNQTIVHNDELSNGQFIYRIIADGKVITSDKIIISQ